MHTTTNEELFTLAKDPAGDGFVCPLDVVNAAGRVGEADTERCVEQDVVGRYAGHLKIVTPTN